jgi:hypothetical protein
MKNNEVMRLGLWGKSFATEVVLLGKLGKNEVLNRLFNIQNIFCVYLAEIFISQFIFFINAKSQ